jgi:pyruvate carboxylase
MELDNLEARLVEKYGRSNISNKDVLSAALYPKVFEEYQSFVLRYSDLIEKLPTRAFLAPLKEDEEVEIELSKVRTLGLAGHGLRDFATMSCTAEPSLSSAISLRCSRRWK